jgi:hypothetical protein
LFLLCSVTAAGESREFWQRIPAPQVVSTPGIMQDFTWGPSGYGHVPGPGKDGHSPFRYTGQQDD